MKSDLVSPFIDVDLGLTYQMINILIYNVTEEKIFMSLPTYDGWDEIRNTSNNYIHETTRWLDADGTTLLYQWDWNDDEWGNDVNLFAFMDWKIDKEDDVLR
jgi:hypothetical protein